MGGMLIGGRRMKRHELADSTWALTFPTPAELQAIAPGSVVAYCDYSSMGRKFIQWMTVQHQHGTHLEGVERGACLEFDGTKSPFGDLKLPTVAELDEIIAIDHREQK
jgi:hypothetical protein